MRSPALLLTHPSLTRLNHGTLVGHVPLNASSAGAKRQDADLGENRAVVWDSGFVELCFKTVHVSTPTHTHTHGAVVIHALPWVLASSADPGTPAALTEIEQIVRSLRVKCVEGMNPMNPAHVLEVLEDLPYMLVLT